MSSNEWKRVRRTREREPSSHEFDERGLRRIYARIKEVNDLPDLLNLADEGLLKSPLEALIWCVDIGRYPPPEIMLAVRDAWWHYINQAGEISLEHALIEPPKRKGGNFARQNTEKYKRLHLAYLLASALRTHPGMSQIAAAEWCVSEFGLDIEPETFVREVRQDGQLQSAMSIVAEPEKASALDIPGAGRGAKSCISALKRKNKSRNNPVHKHR